MGVQHFQSNATIQARIPSFVVNTHATEAQDPDKTMESGHFPRIRCVAHYNNFDRLLAMVSRLSSECNCTL